jgi:hypothetical protein
MQQNSSAGTIGSAEEVYLVSAHVLNIVQLLVEFCVMVIAPVNFCVILRTSVCEINISLMLYFSTNIKHIDIDCASEPQIRVGCPGCSDHVMFG